MSEAIYILESGQELHNVHSPEDCIGREGGCCIHDPSDHHMRDWPRYWRDDRTMIERICPHGIGHPDPDDLFYQQSEGLRLGHPISWLGIHGCDGCCHA